MCGKVAPAPWHLEETTTDSHESTVSVGIQAALACRILDKDSAPPSVIDEKQVDTRPRQEEVDPEEVRDCGSNDRGENLKAMLAPKITW